MNYQNLRKNFLIIVISLGFSLSIFAQQLNVDETISYIKSQTKKYYLAHNTTLPISNKDDSISLTISEFGFVNIKTWIFWKGQQYSENSEDPNRQYSRLFEDFTFDYRKVQPQIGKDNKTIVFYGYNAIQQNNSFLKSTTSWEGLGLIFDIQGIEKIKNAFEYLFEILKYDERYNRKDDDPFAAGNYNKKVLVDTKEATNQRINLKYVGNLSEISVKVCGITEDMIFDSGASDVTISSDTEKELIAKGLISKDQYLTPSLYKIADGSIVKAKRLTLPYIKVGSFTVKDVVCCVSPSGDVQLLGKSFLNRFSKWTVDNNNHTLILER